MDSIPPDIPLKQCGTCKQWHPATSEYFVRDNSKKDGWHSKCKQCTKLYKQQYYETHKEYVTEHNRLYVEAHKEQKSEYKKQWHERNRERMLERMRLNAPSYREKHNEWTRQHRQTEQGKLSRRTHEHQRRARKRALGGKHTPAQIQEQMQRQKRKCYYCQILLGKDWHVDHVIPLSRGGSDDISNLVIACPKCNREKANKLLHEWRQGGRLL